MPETAIHIPVCMLDERRGFLRGHIIGSTPTGAYHVAWDGLPPEVISYVEAGAKLLDPRRLGVDGIRELLAVNQQIADGKARLAHLISVASHANLLG
jgi:hypothetical protein